MSLSERITAWVLTGLGLTAVWLTPLVAAWRRRGQPAERPPGWRTLIAAALCGLAAAAAVVWVGFDMTPRSNAEWRRLRLGDWRLISSREAAVRQGVERAGALLVAVAQGLSLLALIFAWRAWETSRPDAADTIAEGDAGVDDLDAPFPPSETTA